MTAQTNHATSVDFACFATSFVLEGIQRCSGIFFSWTLDTSEESRQKAAIPFVVSRATAYIVSVVCKDFLRNEKLEISLQCGVFLGILGALLSFVSSDLIWLTICWGIVFGAGIGISSPEPLKVSQKFRTQPFFLLICCAAPSFACILLPYFLQFLLSCYGLCGCLLIVSGLTLNAAPFIMVASYRIRFQLRKPLWRIRKKYAINDIEKGDSQVRETIQNGVDNECFETESCTSVPDPSTETNSNIVGSNVIPSSPHTVLIHKNSNLSPINELNSEITSSNGIIPTSRKNTGLLAKCAENSAFEEDFNDEDILFELKANALRNQANPTSSKSCEDDLTNMPRCAGDKTDTSYRCRKDTIIDAVPKLSVNVFPKNAAIILHPYESDIVVKSIPNGILEESLISSSSKTGVSIIKNKLSDPPIMHTSTQNGMVEKSPTNLFSNIYPLEIKVHVVECTFTEDDVRDGRLLTRSVPNIRRGSYRRHSNSLITSQCNNINFSSPNFAKKYNKPSIICGRSSNPSSNMYLISEDDELTIDANSPSNDAFDATAAQQRKRRTWLKFLKKVFKPTCLVVMYAFVIHEVTLVTLLTIFDDHIDGLISPATGVLPAYGLGGILGRLSVRYWGDRLLLEGSHATAALLFILHGVVVAGILWSPNIYWIGGFYATVGFLEIGISTAVWNLVSDHIEVDAKSPLFATCKLLCGICALFVPYTIGLSRDIMGEYDGLLQITSGLSVLCAFLCYILPKFTFHIKHVRGS